MLSTASPSYLPVSKQRRTSSTPSSNGQVGRPLANCDQCRKSRRKCSRDFPKCEMCVKRNHNCTYFEIAKKLKDGKNVYPKSKPPINNLQVVTASKFNKENQSKKTTTSKLIKVPLSSRTIYWLQNKSCSITSSYNPALVILATRLNEVPGFLSYIQNLDSSSEAVSKKADCYRLDDELRLVTPQLIDIYFNNINPYFPIIDSSNFREVMCQSNWSYSFQLLFNCLVSCALGYHPDVELVQRLWPITALKIKFLLKKTYLLPSLYTVQAYIILGMQTSVNEKDGVSQHGGFFLGLAYKMALLLGVHKTPPFLSQKRKELRLQVWWGIPILEQLVMHCTGRPPTLALCDRYVHLRSSTTPLRVSPQDLKTKSADYHRFTFAYSRLLSRISIIRKTFRDSVTSSIREGIVEPAELSSPKSSFTDYVKGQRALMSESLRLESAFHHWFRSYTDGTDASRHKLHTPKNDYFAASIYLNYFLALHELNVSLRQSSDQNGSSLKNFDFNNPSIDVVAFSQCSPTEKCIITSLLGAHTLLYSIGFETFVFHGTNYKWWCAGQFLFTLLEITQKDPLHPALPLAKNYLNFMLLCLKEGKSRWFLLNDFTRKASFIQNLLSPSH